MDNYIYRDRKMMKWIPFNALMEQSDYLSDLLHGRTRIEKPILSPDQEEELNYNLEMACIFKNEILVSYFENGEINSHPKPFDLRRFRIGVLTTAHMAGPAPFP
jgi:hypothetical protein